MGETAADRNSVEALAEEFAERCRRGERPNLSEYTQKHPQWAEQIRDLFPALVALERLKPALPRPEVADIPAAGAVPERLGDFRILRLVGRGGMGVVYEAIQESLGRRVALKVLPGGYRPTPHALERFRLEARAAARLHHTNIVPVFGVGEHEGVPYYAMQFIQGQGLDRVLEDAAAAPQRRGRLRPTARRRRAPAGRGSPSRSLADGRSITD